MSDPLVIDNTPPRIKRATVQIKESTATVRFTAEDEYTAIGRVSYTVDSNDDWISSLPNDLIYDTTDEDFTIKIEDLEPGEHVVAVRVADDLGNTVYKTFDIEIK